MEADSSDCLLGELEEYLDALPSSTSGSTAVTSMTAATKAVLGEHLRSHIGGNGASIAEKRKSDDTHDLIVPKAQKLDLKMDQVGDLEDIFKTDRVGATQDMMYEQQQQQAEIPISKPTDEFRPQRLLEKALTMEKPRFNSYTASIRSSAMNGQGDLGDVMQNGAKVSEEMKRLNEIAKNSSIDPKTKSEQVMKLFKENPALAKAVAKRRSHQAEEARSRAMTMDPMDPMSQGQEEAFDMPIMNGMPINNNSIQAMPMMQSPQQQQQQPYQQQQAYQQQYQSDPQQQQQQMLLQQQAQAHCGAEGFNPALHQGYDSGMDGGASWMGESQQHLMGGPRGHLVPQGPAPPYPYRGVNPAMRMGGARAPMYGGPAGMMPAQHQAMYEYPRMGGYVSRAGAAGFVSQQPDFVHGGAPFGHQPQQRPGPGPGGYVMRGYGGMAGDHVAASRMAAVGPAAPMRYMSTSSVRMSGGAVVSQVSPASQVGTPYGSPPMIRTAAPFHTAFNDAFFNGGPNVGMGNGAASNGMMYGGPMAAQQQQQQQQQQYMRQQPQQFAPVCTPSPSYGVFDEEQLHPHQAMPVQQQQHSLPLSQQQQLQQQQMASDAAYVDPSSWKNSAHEIRREFLRRLQDALRDQGDPSFVALADSIEAEAFQTCDSQTAYALQLAQSLAAIYASSEREAACGGQHNPQQQEAALLGSTSAEDSLSSFADDIGASSVEDAKGSPKAAQQNAAHAETNPILASLLPLRDSVDEPLSTPPPATSTIAMPTATTPSSSSTGATSSSSRVAFSSESFPSPPRSFTAPPNPFEESSGRPSHRSGRRPSGKNANNPHSVDSGIGSPRSIPSNPLYSPKIHGTSPGLVPASESPPEK